MQCNSYDRQCQAGWILDAQNMHQGGAMFIYVLRMGSS